MLIKIVKNTSTAKGVIQYRAPEEIKNLITKLSLDGKPVEFDLLLQLKVIPENSQFLEMEHYMETDLSDTRNDEIDLADPNWMVKYINTHWFGPYRLEFSNVDMVFKDNAIKIMGAKTSKQSYSEDF